MINSAQRSQRPQSLNDAFSVPDALLRISAVEILTGMARATIHRKVKEGLFCEPVRFNSRCVRWRAGDIQAWLQAHSKGVKHG